jgi:hypothetical protein
MTAYELIFVLDDIGELGDPRVDSIEGDLDAVFGRHDDLCLVTVSVEGTSAYAAGVEGVRRLGATGFTVLRSYPDLVNRPEIAERLDVTRQAVGNWTRGERLSTVVFPTPVHLAANGLWLWGDVVAWHRAKGCETTEVELGFPSIEDHGAIDAYIYTQQRWSTAAGHVRLQRRAGDPGPPERRGPVETAVERDDALDRHAPRVRHCAGG